MSYIDLDPTVGREQAELREQVHRFAAEVLRPAAAALDKMPPDKVIEKDSLYWDVMRQAYELRLHLFAVPEEYGGSGLDPLATHIFLEELGWGSAAFAIGLMVAAAPFSLAAQTAKATGNEALLELVRPFVADNKCAHVGCVAVTEPQHGSDILAAGMRQFSDSRTAGNCRARLDGDEWVISGQKAAWVTNGTVSTCALLYANADPALGPAGGVMMIAPLDPQRVSRGKPWDKLGKRAQNQDEIFFDELRVPRAFALAEGAAYPEIMKAALRWGNSSLGAVYTGVARAAYEEALAYAQLRIQGGKPLHAHQAVAAKLFSMFAKVEQARALSRAVIGYNLSDPAPESQFSNAAKIICTQLAFEVANDAVQIHGASGLSKGETVERLFRDARMGLIEDGANDFLGLAGFSHIMGNSAEV